MTPSKAGAGNRESGGAPLVMDDDAAAAVMADMAERMRSRGSEN
jgi:hypothetical protein